MPCSSWFIWTDLFKCSCFSFYYEALSVQETRISIITWWISRNLPVTGRWRDSFSFTANCHQPHHEALRLKQSFLDLLCAFVFLDDLKRTAAVPQAEDAVAQSLARGVLRLLRPEWWFQRLFIEVIFGLRYRKWWICRLVQVSFKREAVLS